MKNYNPAVRRVGGILANHPGRRLSPDQICGLTGMNLIEVNSALFTLHREKLVSRRRVRYVTPFFGLPSFYYSYKIRPLKAHQLPIVRAWIEEGETGFI